MTNQFSIATLLLVTVAIAVLLLIGDGAVHSIDVISNPDRPKSKR